MLLLTAQRKLKQREAHALECWLARLVAGMVERAGGEGNARVVKRARCRKSSTAVRDRCVRERREEGEQVGGW